jgi:uncharacterized protein YdaU (DUF1376 family)
MYPKDILTDENCSAMTLEEFGAYMRLLLRAWIEGSIPSEPTRLARMLGIRRQSFDRIWPAIAPCFLEQDGRLIQQRLEQERSRQRERSAVNSAKGKLGGRPFKSTKHESRGLTTAKPEESLPSSSPSSASITTETTNNGSVRTDVRTEASGLQLTIVKANDVPASARTLNESQAAHLVFDFWRARTGQTRAQWTEERRKRLVSRLREEPGDMAAKVRGLCLAVEGALRDPLFNGSEKGTAYLGFENLFVHKGRDRIEKLQRAALAEDGPPVGAAGAPRDELEASNKRAIEEAMRRHYEEHPDEQPVEKKALQPHVGFARVLPRNKG